MKKFSLSLFLMFLALQWALSENRIFDVHDGLAENTVRSIVQDRTGYIWFATKDGLSRYNGREMVNFGSSSEMEESISLNIEALLLHEDGESIWCASRAGLFLFDPESETFSNYIDVSCSSLCYDADGRLWVGSNDGLYRYDSSSESWTGYRTEGYEMMKSDRIAAVHCDSRGIVWVGTEKGLSRYDDVTDNFRPVFVDGDRHGNVTSISEDRNGIVWIGTWSDGIARLEINKNLLDFYDNLDFHEIIRSIFHAGSHEMYICSDSGLYLFNHESGTIISSKFEEWMPDKSYRSFYEDREGGYWIGTYFSGVCYISPKSRNMEIIRPGANCAVGQFCEMKDNTIMVATENYGLMSFNPKTKEIAPAPFKGLCDNIHSMCLKGDNLWIGTFGEGLVKADLNTNKLVHYRNYMPNSIPNDHVYALCLTRSDELIIGTMRGACTYSYRTGKFTRINTLGDSFIYDVIEDNYGKVWFAAYGMGVWCLNTGSGEWKHYEADRNKDGTLCSNNVIRIYVDGKDQLWFCTEGAGICRYDYKDDRFVVPEYDTPDGKLPDNVVFGILEDNEGNQWLSTNNGLFCCDRKTGKLRQYSFSDGVQSKQFNYKSSYKSRDGRLYFGGIDGFNAFYPNQLKDNVVQPALALRISYDDDGKAVSIPCSSVIDVSIPRRIRNFTMNLECLSFVSPSDNSFKYKLNDGEWVYTGNHQVSFINMEPGRYALTVKAINGDGYESVNECNIDLYVQPPLLQSVVAKIIYVILAFSFMALAVTYRIRRKNLEMKRTLEEMRLKNEQESYDAKIRFFTQIVHEIKTPLTLIKAPLEIIRRNGRWDDEAVRNLDIISSNTDRLMSLIKELLDFKKISKDGYKLKVETVDAVILAKEAVKGFMTSDMNRPVLNFSSAKESIVCDLDPEALVKIISNLVSNSVRFARTEIKVSLDTLEDGAGLYLRIAVADDGPGISESEKEKVFDAFYQSSCQSAESSRMGVGLGLSLVKLLVEKHDGKVYLNDSAKPGCEIYVDIPMKTACPQEMNADVSAAEESAIRLLLVEDTEDLRNFLLGNLRDSFNVVGAADGVEALCKLHENDFDIIVSDIFMPEMDGFELLKAVREDKMLCHIPFVLLSAETSSESKIKGLERGADSYMEKPFSMVHLKAVIENLVSNRRLIQNKFSVEPLEKHNVSGMSSYDSEWLEKLDSLINAGMSENDFSIDKLASSMCMSRSNFQRKLKGLLNMSPNDYIKLMRLKKAAELLLDGHYKINEVCYIVGFNNPSYFANCFHKQFGLLPKDFISQNIHL